MPEIPTGIIDAGLVAIVLFLFVSTVWIILKIVQVVKNKTPIETNGRRMTCIQSPQLQTIMTNQKITMHNIEEIKEDSNELKANMMIQTKLIERIVMLQEKMSDCLIKLQAGK